MTGGAITIRTTAAEIRATQDAGEELLIVLGNTRKVLRHLCEDQVQRGGDPELIAFLEMLDRSLMHADLHEGRTLSEALRQMRDAIPRESAAEGTRGCRAVA